MEIVKTDEGSGGTYSVRIGVDEAVMTYSRASAHLIIIDHTEVPDSMRGKGVGQALALHAVEDARAGGWKIFPLCPFFRAQATRHGEWRDVVNM